MKKNGGRILKVNVVYFHTGIKLHVMKWKQNIFLLNVGKAILLYIAVQSFSRPRTREPLYSKLSLYILKENKRQSEILRWTTSLNLKIKN